MHKGGVRFLILPDAEHLDIVGAVSQGLGSTSFGFSPLICGFLRLLMESEDHVLIGAHEYFTLVWADLSCR